MDISHNPPSAFRTPTNQGLMNLPNNYASGGWKGYPVPASLTQTASASAFVVTLPHPASTAIAGPYGVWIIVAGLTGETLSLKIGDGTNFSEVPTGLVNATTGALAAPATLANGTYLLPSNFNPAALQFTKSAAIETATVVVGGNWVPSV